MNDTKYKNIIKAIGFIPKENATDIFQKQYSKCNNYIIEIDFKSNKIKYGNHIKSESKTTQNFSQAENFVVLECVNRLLEQGYQPQNIILEKTWKTGDGTSGRLDILVTRDNGSAYLMIECKTWGKEFNKAFDKLKKDGGQLFTYFHQDRNAEVIMLYASELDGEAIRYNNEIIKIEESYRNTANVKDLFNIWNKLLKTNGVFDTSIFPYNFKSKALIKKDLKELKEKDSSIIFNRFLEILRRNIVSDKSNAFNKIFTLFLCKIIDEDKNDNDQVDFQWLEGIDDHISFQKRLTYLYNRGMNELLDKTVVDITDTEFDKQFQQIDEVDRNKIKNIFTELRLKKNNEFAIKEVYDDASFQENAKVVKEVVELLQVYQIRYNYRQQFLSDFFELLLTTGLKQESGQFFTPVPIARFIIKSLPFQEITKQKLESGNKKDLLPAVIDYAAGSGHFITESMEEVQKYIETLKPNDYIPSTKKELKSWEINKFDWAEDYVYGIEKDYRLVKTAKVSCYLHGDGLAKVIHGDGLGDFSTSTEFKDLLTKTDETYSEDNKQFDVIISNPPYSVSAFKSDMMNEEKGKKAFDLYDKLTNQSSEIECLFIERTKQLLKDGGVAGIILPSSILSNTGIYTMTREIILKYFDIIAIAEMGSNTFMATGTNTVTLFLRRRNNADWINIKTFIKEAIEALQDRTINSIENPISKYVAHVWENISFDDYKTLLQKDPNENIKNHEIYQEYQKKIKAKDAEDKFEKIVDLEKDKLLYFIITLPQKIVIIKTNKGLAKTKEDKKKEKKEEKRFLGYEFSNRRGSEGIHPIQRSKNIDECSQLYDADIFTNPQKASTYIYKAFSENKFDLKIPENLKQNISYQNLDKMLSFDRIDFDKNISLSLKKKIQIESQWPSLKLRELSKEIINGSTPSKNDSSFWNSNDVHWLTIPDFPNFNLSINSTPKFISNKALEEKKVRLIPKKSVLISCTATIGKVAVNEIKLTTNQQINSIVCKDSIIPYYLANILKIYGNNLIDLTSNSGVQHVNLQMLGDFKIPLPPKNIQKKIVSEIEILEIKEIKTIEEIQKLEETILLTTKNIPNSKINKIEKFSSMLKRGKSAKYGDSEIQIIKSGQARGYKKFDFSEKHFVNDKFILDERQLQKGDILINSSGVGTAGRVTLFDIEGVFVADSHITILRINQDIALPNFILYSLANLGFTSIENMATGQSGQVELSLSIIRNIKIEIPPIFEQKKVVVIIEKIEKKIHKLEELIKSIPEQKEEILKKYLE